MDRKLKIYISLPISGQNLESVKERAAALKELLSSVCEPITPFDVCSEQDKPYSYYMGRDIEALLECDAIFMADGWKFSKGCNCEHCTAITYGLRTFYEEDFHPDINHTHIISCGMNTEEKINYINLPI